MPQSKTVRVKPTLVSLFTGAGGLDIGLESAGFETVAAVDADSDCAATLRLNKERGLAAHKRGPLTGASILELKIEDVETKDLKPEGAGKEWCPDLLAGGPPCQPFSSAGSMLSLQDPRGRLFEHFVRLAKELRPRLILFENVRGLVTAVGPKGEPGEALALVKKEFEGIGYATTFATMNAADFGAPQRRVRLFMMATRDRALPSFPAPTHSEKPAADLFSSLKPWVTLGEFLRSLPAAEDTDVELPTEALAAQLKDIPNGSGLKSAGARETTRPGGHWGYKQGTFISDQNRPARTVTAATRDWIRDSQGRLRRLTWKECAALQGFPSDWQFVGKKASRLRQIGNAVPAVFGEVLGRTLIDALRSEVRVKKPLSAPWPSDFAEAISYTKREHRTNGASRAAVRAALTKGDGLDVGVKGLGSSEPSNSEQGGPSLL